MAKNINIEIGKIKFDEMECSGNSRAIDEISRRLGKRPIKALQEDTNIRVQRDSAGHYVLVSGHTVFRVLRACLRDSDRIPVRVCEVSDDLDPEIYRMTSLLINTAVCSRSEAELLATFRHFRKNAAVTLLGTDFDLEETWQEILKSGPVIEKVRRSPSLPKQGTETGEASTDLADKPVRRRGRPRKHLGPDAATDQKGGVSGPVEECGVPIAEPDTPSQELSAPSQESGARDAGPLEPEGA